MPRKNKIVIRNGTSVPVASDFVTGEPAFNSSTGAFYVKDAAGNMVAVSLLDGNKGDITVNNSGASWTINANAVVTADIANSNVTYAKLQNVSATDRLLGRSTAGAGVVEEITCTAFGRSLLDDADATAARTTLGLNTTFDGGLGSVGAPTFTFTSDTNTGMYSPGADQLAITTGGTQRMVFSAAGDVGIGVGASANVKLYALQNTTNVASSVAHQVVTTCNVTANGGYAAFGGYFVIRTEVAASTTNTGAQRGFFVSVARNNNGAGSADNGTLTYLRGAEIQYGHAVTNTALTPTTTQVVGVFLSPLAGYGTVTDMYDLYLAADSHNLGTITNHWAIYQASTTAKNFFQGNTGIGSSRANPTSALDVNGVITVTAGAVGAPAICFSGDTNTGIYAPAADTVAVTTGGVERLRITSDGKIGINATPGATTTLLQGASTSATTSGNDVGVNTTLNCAATSGAGLKIGLQSTVNSAAAQVAGFPMFGVVGTILSNSPAALSGAQSFRAICSMQSGNGSLSSYTGYYATGASVTGGTVTTQYGFLCESSLTTATNNYGFTSQIAAGTGRWNLNITGTAQNYIAGNVGIGASRTTPATALDVNGVITVTAGTVSAPAICFSGSATTGIYSPAADHISVATSGLERLRVASSGELRFIGSTSGYVAFQSPAAPTTHTYTLPSATGTTGQVLTTDGAGVLSWATDSRLTKTLASFTARDNHPPTTNFATLDTRNSILVLEFDAATEESATFIGVIPENASLASGLTVRLWWMGDTATSGNVRWGVQFEDTGTDLDADSYDTNAQVTSAASGTSGIESVASITITTIDSLAAGDRFRLRVYRVAADATNDTMTGDAQLVAVEVRAA